MAIRLTIIITLSTLLLVSCRKNLDPLQEDIGTPQFFISGDIDDVPFSFVAGENGYYMETDFVQNRDTNGNFLPLSLRSYLTKKGCKNCPNSLSIYVNTPFSDSLYPGFDIDSVFFVGREIPITSDSTFDFRLYTKNNVLVLLSNSSIASERYYSSGVVQPNKMKITKVEPYSITNNGFQTVKVSYDFVCLAVDATYTPIKTITASGTFAFAYPY